MSCPSATKHGTENKDNKNNSKKKKKKKKETKKKEKRAKHITRLLRLVPSGRHGKRSFISLSPARDAVANMVQLLIRLLWRKGAWG